MISVWVTGELEYIHSRSNKFSCLLQRTEYLILMTMNLLV